MNHELFAHLFSVVIKAGGGSQEVPAVKSRLPCLGLELEIDWGKTGR